MSLSLTRTLHLDPEDVPLLLSDNPLTNNLLKHKFILRAANEDEGKSEIEEAFSWVKENCQNHYIIRGPEHDVDTIKYFIYFADEEEATQFKLTFPTR